MNTRRITMDSRRQATVGEEYLLYLSIRDASHHIVQSPDSRPILVEGPNATETPHARFKDGIACVAINLQEEGRYTIRVDGEEVGCIEAVGTSQVATLKIEPHTRGAGARVGDEVIYDVTGLKQDGSADDCFNGLVQVGVDGAAVYDHDLHLCNGKAQLKVKYWEAGCHQVAVWLDARPSIRKVAPQTVTPGIATQLKILTKSRVVAGQRIAIFVQACDDAQNAAVLSKDCRVELSSPNPCIETQPQKLSTDGSAIFHTIAPHDLGVVELVVNKEESFTYPIRPGRFTFEVVARRRLELVLPERVEAGVPFWCSIRALDRNRGSGPYDGTVSITVEGKEIQRTVPTGDGRVELTLHSSDRQKIEVRDDLGSVPVEKWVTPVVAAAAPALPTARRMPSVIALGR